MIELHVFLFAVYTCAITTVVLFLCGGKKTGNDDKPAERKKGWGAIWDMDYYGEVDNTQNGDATKAMTLARPPAEQSKMKNSLTPGYSVVGPQGGVSKVQTEVKPEDGGKADATKATTVEKPTVEGNPKAPTVVEPEKGPSADAPKAPLEAQPPSDGKPKVPAMVEPEKGPKADAPKAPLVAIPPAEGKPKVPAVPVESTKGPKADAPKAPAVEKPPVEGKPKVPAVVESAKGPKAEAAKAPPVAKPPAEGKPKVPAVVGPANGPKAVGAEHPQISVTLTVVKWEFLAGQDVFKVQNQSDQRIAFKLKTSDNGIYTVNPVSGFLEPGKTIPIVIIRKQCPFKPDKIECLAAGATATDKDALAVFNKPNLKTEIFTVTMEKKPEIPAAKKPEKK